MTHPAIDPATLAADVLRERAPGLPAAPGDRARLRPRRPGRRPGRRRRRPLRRDPGLPALDRRRPRRPLRARNARGRPGRLHAGALPPLRGPPAGRHQAPHPHVRGPGRRGAPPDERGGLAAGRGRAGQPDAHHRPSQLHVDEPAGRARTTTPGASASSASRTPTTRSCGRASPASPASSGSASTRASTARSSGRSSRRRPRSGPTGCSAPTPSACRRCRRSSSPATPGSGSRRSARSRTWPSA